MGGWRRNITAAFENKVREAYPKNGKRENNRLRSLFFLFIILAIAATVNDLRREPLIDDAQAAFVSQAEQVLDAAKSDLWLGGVSAENLLEQGGWSEMDDYARSTLENVAEKFLGTPATVYDWTALKMETIHRLWLTWETQSDQSAPEAYLAEKVSALVDGQELPGLERGLWLAVTSDGERYILTSRENRWAICPEEVLR